MTDNDEIFYSYILKGLIEKSSLQSFPKKDIRHGNKVGGELVARRQKELLIFFQLLFMHHPKLWE